MWELKDLFVVLYSIIELGCLVELSKCLKFEKQCYSVKSYVLLAIMLLISVYINIFDKDRFFQIFQYVCFAGVLLYSSRIKVLDSIICSILCFMLVGILELISYTFCVICQLILHIKGDCSFYVVIITFLDCLAIEKMSCFASYRKWINTYRKHISSKYIFGIFILLSIIFEVSILKFDTGMTIGNTICLVISVLVFFILIYDLCKHQVEIEWHKKYAEKYGEIVTEIRSRQHKIVNQLNSICSLHTIYDNYDDLVQHQMLESNLLKGYIMPNKVLILDRPLVAAHIYNKIYEAEEKGIKLNTDLSCSIQKLDIPDIFLVEIIGNLLDNAMDEVETRMKNEEIRLKIKYNDGRICILVSNEHDKIPYSQYSQFFIKGYSVKGENRGLGLPYVKKIVKKYNGYIQVGNVEYGQHNFFEIRIYL